MRHSLFILLTTILLATQMVRAQDTVTVPDVTGTSIPAATAALNRIGIAVNSEISEPPNSQAGMGLNMVSAQSIAPGTPVETGTAVDLTIQRAPNTLLIYDDNDLTLVNQTGGDLDLSGISLHALDGNGATFAANQWGNWLRDGSCAQIWSIRRTGSKDVSECQSIEYWRAMTDERYHFWTGIGGTTRFDVIQDGVERAVCMVANPGRCEIFLPSSKASASDFTDYVYIIYTQDRLAVINNTENLWMPLNGLTFLNNAVEPRGQIVPISDTSLYGSHLNPVADLRRLAPGQCILYTNSAETQSPPQPCDVIAWLAIDPSLTFWRADFTVDSVTDNLNHTCPAQIPEQTVLCIMPR